MITYQLICNRIDCVCGRYYVIDTTIKSLSSIWISYDWLTIIHWLMIKCTSFSMWSIIHPIIRINMIVYQLIYNQFTVNMRSIIYQLSIAHWLIINCILIDNLSIIICICNGKVHLCTYSAQYMTFCVKWTQCYCCISIWWASFDLVDLLDINGAAPSSLKNRCLP